MNGNDVLMINLPEIWMFEPCGSEKHGWKWMFVSVFEFKYVRNLLLILVYILLAAEMVWKSCTTELPHTRTTKRIIIPMPSGYLKQQMTSNWISKDNFLEICCENSVCFLKLGFLFLDQLAVGILTEARESRTLLRTFRHLELSTVG